MDNRIKHLDILKGITIVLVVMGHFLSWCYPNFVNHLDCFDRNQIVLWSFIYSFHMPLFMFVSGVVAFNQEKEYRISIIFKRIISYLIPFVCIGSTAVILRTGGGKSRNHW